MIAMEAGARELYSEAIPRKMTPRNYEKYWNDVCFLSLVMLQ
jgi:hypothetical protein